MRVVDRASLETKSFNLQQQQRKTYQYWLRVKDQLLKCRALKEKFQAYFFLFK